MKKKGFVVLLFFPLFFFAQNQKKIDSVLYITKTVKNDSIKAVEHLELSNLHKNKDSIFYHLIKSMYHARIAHVPKFISNARANMSNWKSKEIGNRAGIQENIEAIEELKKYNYSAGIANHYIRLGYRYNNINKDSARFYLNQGVKMAEKAKDENVLITGYFALGNMAFFMKDYEKALEYYFLIEKICDQSLLSKGSIKHATSMEYIGYVMEAIDKPEKAIMYFEKSKYIYEKNANPKGILSINASIANIHIDLKEYKKAISILNETIDYYEGHQTESSKLILAYLKKASCLEKLQETKNAENLYLKALDVSLIKDNKIYIKDSNIALAGFYSNTGNFKEALAYYLKSQEICEKEKDEKKLEIIYRGLSNLFYKKKNFQKSADYSLLLNKQIESIYDKNTKEKIIALEAKYQNEKKQQEITLLSVQNKLAEKQKANQRNVFLGLLGGVLMVIGFLFYGYRNKLKTATRLKELEELKSRFFANISHEFRTPLTLIKSPLQQLQQSETSEGNKKKLDLIDQNSNRMLELVDQLLELSKLNPDSFRPVFKKKDIALFLKSMIDPFMFEAKNKDIRFNAHIHDGSCWYDRDIVEKIVSNLLSNALKYTSQKEEVVFLSAFEKDKLHLSVSNSGVDLKTSEVNQIFDRFYQHKESNQGVGIGLALVKELVTLCKGELKTKLSHKVLTIDIYLPVDIKLLKTIGVISEHSDPKEGIAIHKENPRELPVLLLAEDNADVRLVLKEIFSSDFHIVEAENGEKALQIIQKEMPDIVITDVMMPKMNGFELCRKSKQNEMTSFIPIILLTAKTGDEAHLEGLQSNADAFVTKPFSHEILKLKVNQLLEERKKMRERYSQELILKPKDIFIDSVDEKFIERLQVILDTHLSNAEFSTDQFAAEAGMSRMQLHRKLKTLLGFSATEFLRHERLKAAAILLEKGEGTIAEIAYSVGFNDVVYFSKCFKDIYNIPPSKYLIKNK